MRGKRREGPVDRPRLVVAAVELAQLIVERPDTVGDRDVVRDAGQAPFSTGGRIREDGCEMGRRGGWFRRRRDRRRGLGPENRHEPSRQQRPHDLGIQVGLLLRAGHGRLRRLERRIVPQDAPVELLELAPRQQADLVEPPAAQMEGGVRLDVPSGLVEREHQVPHELLAVAVDGREALELGDHLGVAPEREVSADPLLQRVEPECREPADLVLDAGLVRQVRQRLAAPERERLAKRPCARSGACSLRARSRSRSKRKRSSCIGLDPGHVSGSASFDDLGAEQTPEVRHAVLDRVRRRARRSLAPKPVDEQRRSPPTRFACSSRSASSARSRGAVILISPESPRISIGPRIENCSIHLF